MHLYSYRGRSPNFGDDLNTWLFPRLLPGAFDADDATLFLGIGSILFDTHPAGARKIVFGSGCGGYTTTPRLDASWDVRFVRGPMTAAKLGLPAHMGVGDSAILLAGQGLVRAPLAGRRIYMPHADSACDGAWRTPAEAAGLRYVDPRAPVHEVLGEILAAELVVTEAMHGAIVADALRVPWVAMRPLFAVHHAKWADWGGALGIVPRFHELPASNALEFLLRAVDGRREPMRRLRWHLRKQTGLGAALWRDRAAGALRRAAAAEPQLSGDAALDQALSQMQAQVAALR
jgi:succinoglycan biosynthesis protein ExoV